MILDPQPISDFFAAAAAWGTVFLAALWLSLIVWTYRDIRLRSHDKGLRLLAVIISALFFLPGVVLYVLFRPARTLDEEYHRTLEEEALLQSIEDQPVCPGCGRHTRDDWMVCPSCHTRLKKLCHHCGKLMELSWNLCPYCGTPTPGMRKEHLPLGDVNRRLPPKSNILAEDVDPQEARLNKYSAP